MKLKFSIVTPSLNQGRFIKDTIDSVLKQDYENFEHIIVDGGSKDDTIDIIKQYSHIKLISGKDTGPSNAINIGFQKATGDIGAWINSDDYYELNIFNYINEAFIENEDIGMVFGKLTLIDENKNIIKREEKTVYNLEDLIRVSSDSIRQPCTFYKLDLYKSLNGLNENLKLVFDYELFLRMMHAAETYYMDKNLAYYRDYDDTLTRKFVRRQAFEIFQVARKNGANLSDKIVKRVIRKFITGKP